MSLSRVLALPFTFACIFAGSMASAADVTFATKPAATSAGDQVKISFAASAATDVEVAIVGADGRVVRHLAAGMLGKNAPEPLQKDSLAQELLWDGKDDAGKEVPGLRAQGSEPTANPNPEPRGSIE